MPKRCFVGIDLGGTNIKGGVVDEDGKVLCKRSIRTEAENGPDHVIDLMAQLVERVIAEAGLTKSQVEAVGIGSPGSMSHTQGIVIKPPNLPGWQDVPLRDRIKNMTGLPTTLENDANAAAWGEFWAGAGKGTRHMVMLTLGTGVGGGVITNGKLMRGHFDNAAELGHWILQPGGRQCGCGQRGCLEAYASASYTAQRATEAVKAGEASSLADVVKSQGEITSKEVVIAATAGDPLAKRILDETCYYLAIACVNIQHATNPERIVLAGGMIAAGEDALLVPIRTKAAGMTWNAAKDLPQIMFATLGNDAGLIGAAGCAWLGREEGEI
ncbi:MAG: ROK family protein [Phycisphaerae bacterium]|nr:ROK family protein [Phycisphaerae bacterium]